MSRPTNTQFAVAVHVLTMLADAPAALQSSEVLAQSVGANPVHIRRVLGRLRDAGFVDSRPGPHGGWQLLRSPEHTTLADVWEVVHGDDPVLGVHAANPACQVGRRIQATLEDVDRRAAAAIGTELATTTLAQLAAGARPAAAA